MTLMFSRIILNVRLNKFNNNYSRIFVHKQSQLNNVLYSIINNVFNRIHSDSKVVKNEDEDSPGSAKRKRNDSGSSCESIG